MLLMKDFISTAILAPASFEHLRIAYATLLTCKALTLLTVKGLIENKHSSAYGACLRRCDPSIKVSQAATHRGPSEAYANQEALDTTERLQLAGLNGTAADDKRI